MIEEVRSVFRRLLKELPAGTARLNEYRVPKGDGTVLEVIPQRPSCANFGVHVDDNSKVLDFSFGRLGTWELPSEGRNADATAEQLLLEVEQMAQAVISGHCDEYRGLFSLTSRVYVDGYTYKVVDLPMLPIPPFGKKTYESYL